MNDIYNKIRMPDELGKRIREQRKALGMSKSELAQRAGKVREVIYRLEAGDDVTVSSLMAVLAALKLAICLEPAGMPTAQEVARRFMEDEEE
jgi:predicted transcriptional regulator